MIGGGRGGGGGGRGREDDFSFKDGREGCVTVAAFEGCRGEEHFVDQDS